MGGGSVHDAGVLGVVGFGGVKGLKTRSGKSVRGAPDEPESRLGVVDGRDIGIIVTKAEDVRARQRATRLSWQVRKTLTYRKRGISRTDRRSRVSSVPDRAPKGRRQHDYILYQH